MAVDGARLSPARLLERLNGAAGRHCSGRRELGENRVGGLKPRGVYETPGGTLLLAARRGLESIVLDRGAAHLKDELMPRYAELIYNGFWFSPERRMLQAAIDASQDRVSGRVRMKLFKGASWPSAGSRRTQSTMRASPPSRRTRCMTSATPRASSG